MPHLVADAGLLDINGTLIADVVAFIIMLVILAKFAYPRIMQVAEEREKKVEAGVRAAEEAQKRLEQVQEDVAKVLNDAREQAREIIGRSHRDAVVEAQEVLVKARSDAEAVLRRAEAEIGSERDRAIQELRAQVSALVVEAAGRVIGESLDERSHRKLIEEALSKVNNGKAPSGRDS